MRKMAIERRRFYWNEKSCGHRRQWQVGTVCDSRSARRTVFKFSVSIESRRGKNYVRVGSSICATRAISSKRCKNAYGIVHLGAYQAPNLAPDAETLSNNVSATYNVLRAAADAKVKKVVLASSTAAFGFIYAMKLWAPDYLPLDEEHPSTPQDSYGLSKVLGEKIADSIVSVHQDMTISSLRFPGVNFDLSYESFRERWRNPSSRANGFWTYIDARDAANDLPVGAGGEIHRP